MRYLRPVRINESNSDRKALLKVRRYHAHSDAARSGKPGAARLARAAYARHRANTYGNDTAKIPFVTDSAISLGKKEAQKARRLENSSITPLTLPNIMEGRWTPRGYDPRKARFRKNWPMSDRGEIPVSTGNNNNNTNNNNNNDDNNNNNDDRTSGAKWPKPKTPTPKSKT